jgi:DNA-binding LytR/AlgR family response regulator
MNCIIVEDSEVARLDFENKVSQVSFLKLVHSCPTAVEATNVIMNTQVDLVILDVMMPEMDGLQFMQALDKERPQVILVSSDKKFAIDGFEHEVTDFLVKPVSRERFFKAISKAKKKYEERSGLSSHDDMSIFIKVNSLLVRVDSREILYVEALSDYVTIHTTKTKYTVHSTMKGMENALADNHFFRVHNSYIVRLDKIASIEDNCMVIGDKLIPISRSKMKDLMKRLKFLG